MPSTIAERLRELGRGFPETSAPAANYVSTVRTGNLLFVSGQISQRDGEPSYIGRLGTELSVDEGRQAAESAGLGVLAQIVAAGYGRIDTVRRVVRLGVFVASDPSFTAQSQVANGASDLFVAVFGEAGRHARTAVGVTSLPRGVAVEVDAIIELAKTPR